MNIVFCTSLPSDGSGHYCNFLHEHLNQPGYQYIDVKKFCHQNQMIILKDIERWYSSVSTEASRTVSHWWISQSSRLLSWYPAVYDTIVFTAALLQILKADPSVKIVYVLNAPEEVQIYFNEPSPSRSSFYPILKSYLQYLLLYFRSTLGFIKRFLTYSKKTNSDLPREVLFFSQVLSPQNLMNGVDHFYGDSFHGLSGSEKSKISFLYYSPVASEYLFSKIKEKFLSLGFSVFFTSDLFNTKDFLNTLIGGLIHFFQIIWLSQKMKPITILGLRSANFSKEFSKQVLLRHQVIYTELEIHYALKRLKSLSSIKKIIYPYEERSLEKALLLASSGIKSYGFVHAVMHPGHMCYNFKTLPEAVPPRPDVILTTGPCPTSWFATKGYQSSKILNFGSPRNKLSKNKNFPKKLRILIMISQPHELLMLCNIISCKPDVFSNFDVTVRKYPYSGLEDQERGFRRFSTFVPHAKDEAGNLEEQLSQHDIVLFSTSSGGIEAIFHGLIGLYVNLDKLFVLNPLLQIGNQSTIPQAHSVEDLESILKKFSSLTPQELLELQQNQKVLVEQIYAKPDFKKILN